MKYTTDQIPQVKEKLHRQEYHHYIIAGFMVRHEKKITCQKYDKNRSHHQRAFGVREGMLRGVIQMVIVDNLGGEICQEDSEEHPNLDQYAAVYTTSWKEQHYSNAVPLSIISFFRRNYCKRQQSELNPSGRRHQSCCLH